jgi:alpha-L-rhamnosidase
MKTRWDRRQFLKSSAASGGAWALLGAAPLSPSAADPTPLLTRTSGRPPASRLPRLDPAQWIWYPSGRCLPNTFVLFRRELDLAAPPKRATGWLAADSRYLLEVNGRRIQWGPAPADPRWPEADPLDLTNALHAGSNVFGATVLFYGQGDGTWPIGKPGFLFWLELQQADGSRQIVVSDASWKVLLARSWPAGHYKRWYLRALQEEFDARLYPYGWASPGFTPDADWLPAMPLSGSPNQPALSAQYYEYMLDVGGGPPDAELRPRSIPLMRETEVPVQRLTESLWLEWLRPPEEYFAFRVPGAYREVRTPSAREIGLGRWQVDLEDSRGAALTFEFAEQGVGWPYFSVEAPAGTVVELLVHEAHAPGGPALLNTHFDSWTRFICRAGLNQFATFDFESLRWLQLHVHGTKGRVTIRDVGLRRREFPWPNVPQIRCSDPALQRLFEASINTLRNCAQETLVDGMARERQQYSGDGGHQLHAVHLLCGETRLPARFLTTWSQGLTKDGYFLDCWPAYDRLARLIERQLDLSGWGPILDHGIGFNFDCWYHYLYSGDLEALREPYPRLLRFARYLQTLIGPDGLLPVEELGIPSIWIDHSAYQKQRHKQCAFNLYAAAMLEHALAPIARAFGDPAPAAAAAALGASVLRATQRKFWNRAQARFVSNLPWLTEEKQVRLCDRSLATALLFNQCPGGQTGPALQALATAPLEMGLSYPCNANWRYWALAQGGRADVIVRDFRERWATMDSVKLNNTLQEDWQARPDSGQQWSHCALAPLCVTCMSLAGIHPLAPGFRRVEIWPQLADLPDLELTVRTVRGPIHFQAQGGPRDRELSLALPEGCTGEVLVRRETKVALTPAAGPAPEGYLRYLVPAGRPLRLRLENL